MLLILAKLSYWSYQTKSVLAKPTDLRKGAFYHVLLYVHSIRKLKTRCFALWELSEMFQQLFISNKSQQTQSILQAFDIHSQAVHTKRILVTLIAKIFSRNHWADCVNLALFNRNLCKSVHGSRGSCLKSDIDLNEVSWVNIGWVWRLQVWKWTNLGVWSEKKVSLSDLCSSLLFSAWSLQLRAALVMSNTPKSVTELLALCCIVSRGMCGAKNTIHSDRSNQFWSFVQRQSLSSCSVMWNQSFICRTKFTQTKGILFLSSKDGTSKAWTCHVAPQTSVLKPTRSLHDSHQLNVRLLYRWVCGQLVSWHQAERKHQNWENESFVIVYY